MRQQKAALRTLAEMLAIPAVRNPRAAIVGTSEGGVGRHAVTDVALDRDRRNCRLGCHLSGDSDWQSRPSRGHPGRRRGGPALNSVCAGNRQLLLLLLVFVL